MKAIKVVSLPLVVGFLGSPAGAEPLLGQAARVEVRKIEDPESCERVHSKLECPQTALLSSRTYEEISHSRSGEGHSFLFGTVQTLLFVESAERAVGRAALGGRQDYPVVCDLKKAWQIEAGFECWGDFSDTLVRIEVGSS